MNKSDRYQHQNWFVRRWRDRHYLILPILTVRFWLHERTRTLEDADDWRLTFMQCACLAKGMIQVKQKHLHDWSSIKRCRRFEVDSEESEC